ncbi:MAG: undecaprenyl-diphosphate phosphatase [bacterium]|nr:undecaprenyl-diphosphate phosphatase [bacterium]
MIYFYAIIFGIVQGLTEFFPVSSSGHLLIAHKLFPVFTDDIAVTFDVALHLSTLFVILFFYGKDFLKYCRSFYRAPDIADRRIGWMILFATLPAAFVGYFLEDIIVGTTRELFLVATMLILGGLFFIIVERWGKRAVPFEHLTKTQAFLIGCAQAVALIPGVSRSGSTIIAGMALRLKRDAATHFSFLLAVPIIALAGAKRLVDLFMGAPLTLEQILVFLIGFATAAGVGALCIQYLIEHVKTKTFLPFAVYRIALGVLLFGFIFFQK